MDKEVNIDGRRMLRKSTHSIDEVLSLVPEWDGMPKTRRIDFDGDMLYIDSRRYFVFRKDNCTCVNCGIRGSFFAKEKHPNDRSYHLNLYAIAEDGREILMTKDHHIPRSKGGSNDLSNLDTMCSPCNGRKGHKMPGEEGNKDGESNTEAPEPGDRT